MESSRAEKKRRYLEFERPLEELDRQIERLKDLKLEGRVDVSQEITALEEKSAELLKKTMQGLTPYQVVQLARHPDRPTALDYIQFCMDDFEELRGDRKFMDDQALIGGLASLKGTSVMVLGHQKGRTTMENVHRNFGMPKPEGYRKAFRLMEMAERFKLPIISFIDTPGAYPGLDAEERGQAEAIASNLLLMSDLKVPIITVVIGEGGSGGALAIAVSDRLLMLEYTIYSVISPEGCAAITWKDASNASRAAEALKLTAKEIVKAQVADRIIEEPLGGAHRDPLTMGLRMKEVLAEELSKLISKSSDRLVEDRYERFRKLGPFSSSAQTASLSERA